MNAFVSKAHVCGPLGKALAVIDGTTWLYEGQERRRPTSNDIRFFFDFGLEVRPFDPFKDGALNEGR
jgi:hypothetical protein